ncbi:MAG TPA: malto-oligosyltrehalose synthase [Xanthobacteraceae bacterium]|jgi:(1->4)-alpha-D-glucan 1-alpha-D-glucosylmutase|nr:malto-oligosyltrehalose synthase [Xanthobacteraceae bacterium]
MVGVLERHGAGPARPMTPPAIPIATYRLQLTARFGFDDAAKIVPYLRALGISHVYASPILQAHAGSTHGYDVTDPTRLNPELGGDDAFARLDAALRTAGLGLIVDFVPNHMSVHHADNPWWLDVLEWGQASPFAVSFDIDWNALPGRPRLLIPVLGRPYAEALAAGEIELRYDPREGSFSAWYFEHRLPVAPASYRAILRTVVAASGAGAQAAGRAILDLVHAQAGPPNRREAAALKTALAAIPGAADVIAAGLAAYRPARPEGTRALLRLLERQAYRLADWRLANQQINYRRFFDINTLAGLRIEDSGTFEKLHARIASLIADGAVTGLRLDHIDGLSDPAGYCARLHDLVGRLRPEAPEPFYVLIEKILGEDERLPRFDNVAGTTGYEWLNVVSHVLADARGLPALDRLWGEIGGTRPFEAVVTEAKRDTMRSLLASEFAALCRMLERIAAGQPATRDFGAERLRAGLTAFVIQFPVYRTYVTAGGASAADRLMIDRTIAAARQQADAPPGEVFGFLRDLLTLDLVAPGRGGYSRTRALRFVRKLQQFTGPMMAKSLEDTAFYRFHRLLAFNEVGGNPAAGGLGIPAFHRLMRERIETQPHGLTATATHDTKRGEDARARLLALSEIPGDWAAAVAQWRSANAHLIRQTGARRVPSAAHEYMLYQALVSAWTTGHDSELVARLQAYALKAAREGKQETSWLDPDETYEKGLTGFIAEMLKNKRFVDDVDPLARRAALLGALNSLTQLALKIAIPGVPDFYQGSEFWDLSFVDPDNRRPADFAARASALAACDSTAGHTLVESWRDGRIKLALTKRLLAWRRSLADVFTQGDHRELPVEGPHREHVIAFARGYRNDAAILVAGRHFAPLTDGGRRWPRAEDWQGHVVLDGFSLTGGTAGTGGRLALSQAFENVPVAAFRASTGRR